ncbi:tyrosine-type recombinase/integrase [Sinanaerobacter chloroacetimidivorans]|uniref:Tyrosine-type recombinase/integrase n=1 Tax=Sinanaerobacter chloroacetimidivorans TaxID=2818044 RepID=A0A8J7W5H9_9FIRM|nr:tyrosine-type recombinase/integrase [Sinanaerobacter chloroacetimidivorans]MBR0600636.1 tyrosine-type recombinase/integrase [Sinanaerobacter chloroacetimidivorans]
MVNRVFCSHFAGFIQQFIEQKNALGFPYEESIRILQVFDRFCMDKFPHETALTKELCMAWAIRKETEQNNSFRNRLMPVREFARYLNRIGEPAYVLSPDLSQKGPRHMPHIYSEEEIAAFWHTLDLIRPRRGFPIRHLVIPTIFRLIYCCGLRPIEARKLRVENVDLNVGKLKIMESKGHKDRIVMMTDDVTELLRQYHKQVNRIMPGQDLFFPNSQGHLYTKRWIEKTFRIMWDKTGIPVSAEKPPRIYDFRHTFATHRLYMWLREGKDVSAQLPYLSAFMGHSQLSDTYYYIHLVPELFTAMSGLDFTKYESLLPEVEIDE